MFSEIAFGNVAIDHECFNELTNFSVLSVVALLEVVCFDCKLFGSTVSETVGSSVDDDAFSVLILISTEYILLGTDFKYERNVFKEFAVIGIIDFMFIL
ncbi:hypothetical protein DERF_001225, partial [Dermatophagoides farinae]